MLLKIYLESYGCTLNHGEARYLKDLLISSGHVFIENPEPADIVVLFSCCVIETTELKMLRRAKRFSELGKPLIVSGCMAVVQRAALESAHDNVHLLPPREVTQINSVIDKIAEHAGLEFEAKVVPVEPEEMQYFRPLTDDLAEFDTAGDFEEELGESIDSIVPIATGCKGQCNYCITRLARGELNSYSEVDILTKITKAVSAGRYEVRLTAQDTACYGYDENSNLAALLNRIAELHTEHDFRVRVGMLNPDSVKPIVDELVESFEQPRVFKFLHIPVQSGDDEMLGAMGRKYTINEFFAIIEKFREKMPTMTISTDIIIGYPNETEQQFNKSMALLERLKPNMVNITRFSARPGTPAADIKYTLPGKVVKARSRAMTDLRFKISEELNKREIGNTYRLLITERVKVGSVLGRTDNYMPVVVKKSLPLGIWLDVEVIEAMNSYLIGKEVV
jgi:MiaB-like tRNA modifying enzyme